MQWPGVPGLVKITVQVSRVIPVGRHDAPSEHSYFADTLDSSTQGRYWVPDQRPFTDGSRMSPAATAPQPQPDII
jgi:hypothetical protein